MSTVDRDEMRRLEHTTAELIAQRPTKNKELTCFVCDKSMSNANIVIMHKSCYDDRVDGLR